MNGLLMQQDLIAKELQLQINRVIVKPFSAILGKIRLTQPSRGTMRVVFNEENLTCAFNSQSFRTHLPQGKQVKIYLQQVNCHLLADGNIAFHSDLMLTDTKLAQSVAFTVERAVVSGHPVRSRLTSSGSSNSVRQVIKFG